VTCAQRDFRKRSFAISSQIISAIVMMTPMPKTAGLWTDSHGPSMTRPSSKKLAPMFVKGSDETLIAARVAILVAAEVAGSYALSG
jgi:hypothetical protein